MATLGIKVERTASADGWMIDDTTDVRFGDNGLPMAHWIDT